MSSIITWADIAQLKNECSIIGSIPSYKINNNILITDTLKYKLNSGIIKTLVCYHYDRSCSKNSSEETKKFRGIIIDTNTNDQICKTFGFVNDYTLKELQNYSDSQYKSLFPINSIVCNSYEGFNIRIFYHNGLWYISTHKCIDAFYSKWASNTSYGDIFVDTVKYFIEKNNVKIEDTNFDNINIYNKYINDDNTNMYVKYLISKLNKNMVYDFLVSNNSENRIVSNMIKTPFLYLMGVFDKSGKYFVAELDKIDFPFTKLENLDKNIYENFESLKQYILKMDSNKYQGILIINTDTGELSKIFNDKYYHYMNIRGSTPDILLRFIELYLNNDAIDDFYDLFSEYSEMFDYIKQLITNIIPENIRNIYNIRYVDNNYYRTDKITHFILRNLHSSGLYDISIDTIKEELKKLSPVAFYKIIKTYLYENGNDEEGGDE
jgi:hypothetical protein